jgi:hypothetical protein
MPECKACSQSKRCLRCVGRERVARWRRVRARQRPPVGGSEYCWACGDLCTDDRLRKLEARQSPATTCSATCASRLRQQRRRFGIFGFALPTVRVDGVRLPWALHEDLNCQASKVAISQLSVAEGLDEQTAVLNFLASRTSSTLCNRCGLFRILRIGERLPIQIPRRLEYKKRRRR